MKPQLKHLDTRQLENKRRNIKFTNCFTACENRLLSAIRVGVKYAKQVLKVTDYIFILLTDNYFDFSLDSN